MPKSIGKLRYSPKLVGQRSEHWWLVIDCDPQLAAYYRNLFLLENYRCKALQRPSWNAHVTVIRNEEPPCDKKSLWHKYEGQSVEYSYEPSVVDNGLYYWLPVDCDWLYDLREELGLPRNPIYNFHLTIGNLVVDSQTM